MIFIKDVYATCPVCVVTVGGGLWLAEKLGVDDFLVAIWIGALTTALAILFADKERKIKIPYARLSFTVVFYFLTLATLKLMGKISDSSLCQWGGVSKIFWGITAGTVVFGAGVLLDQFLRRQNKGKVFFPFQKVIVPFVMTVFASLIGYWFLC